MRFFGLRVISAMILVLSWLVPLQESVSAPLKLSYSGRFVAQDGVPVAGPVAIKIRFFDAQVNGTQLGADKDFEAVQLQEGVFQLVIGFLSSELALVFPENSETWIQVTDATHGIDYERQMLTSTPFAMRIPVDGASLVFSNEDGKLKVNELRALNLKATKGKVVLSPHQDTFGDIQYTLPKADGTSGQVLATQGNGQLNWVEPSSLGNTLDSNLNNAADSAEDASKLGGQEPGYYLDMANMQSGGGNLVFTQTDKDRLDALSNTNVVSASSVDSAGAVMVTDLPGQSGLLTTDGSGGLGVDTTAYLSSESDPKVGDLSGTSGNWCASNGSVVQCDKDAPVEFDGTNRLPAADGSQLTNLNLAAPGAIGGSTPNTGTFSSLRLHDGDSNYMSLNAPALSDNTTSYTLPASPVDGQYLMTSASGDLSWADPAAANSSAISTINTNLSSLQAGAVMDADFGSNGFMKRSGSGTYTVSATVDTNDVADEAVTNAKLSSSLQTSVSVLNSATNSNAASAIVRRDASGDFSAGTITASLNGNASSATNVVGTVGLANGGTGASTASGARTALELGTVATLDAGNGALNIPQLDGSGHLPALNASALTNINADQIDAGTLSNDRLDFSGVYKWGSSSGMYNRGQQVELALTGGANTRQWVRVSLSDTAAQEINIYRYIHQDGTNLGALSARIVTNTGSWGSMNAGPIYAVHSYLITQTLFTIKACEDSDTDGAGADLNLSGIWVELLANNAGQDLTYFLSGGTAASPDVLTSEPVCSRTESVVTIPAKNGHYFSEDFHVNGNLTLTGSSNATAHNSSSDRRYKKNIQNLENALDLVKQLKGRVYEWRVEDFPNLGFKDGEDFGLIAQEVEEVFPQIVLVDSDGYKSIDYSKLVSPLIEAVKELDQRDQAKDQEMARKEQRINDLEEQNLMLKAYLCAQDSQAPFCEEP